MNADMQSYDNLYSMIDMDLVKEKKLHAALVDNFILRYTIHSFFKE